MYVRNSDDRVCVVCECGIDKYSLWCCYPVLLHASMLRKQADPVKACRDMIFFVFLSAGHFFRPVGHQTDGFVYLWFRMGYIVCTGSLLLGTLFVVPGGCVRLLWQLRNCS